MQPDRRPHSVALSADIHDALTAHLLRADGQEDICLATYSVSDGETRTSRLLTTVELPRPGERAVHGNASFTGDYVLRVASLASQREQGVAILHSHPRGRGWQGLSADDHAAERSYAHLVEQMTGTPLIGLTLAGTDQRWSARSWQGSEPNWAESVRVVGARLTVSWNDALIPAPRPRRTQVRTISAWGSETQASLARLRVLVVGVGSVGLDLAQRLTATGIRHVAVMDYDVVEPVNLDRMVGATRRDARLHRPKVEVAARLMRRATTAREPIIRALETSICSPEGLATALDFDVIFSCVDRPWPRAVLNTIAYADLIPVIDGGISIDTFPNGNMRGASWRAHTMTPGRPCLTCTLQLPQQEVTLDMQGLLDDPEYIANTGRHIDLASPNVAALSGSVSAAQLAQFVSLVAAPGGQGVPAPLRYILAPHILEQLPHETLPYCRFEGRPGEGASRIDLTRESGPWTKAANAHPVPVGRQRVRNILERLAEGYLNR